MVNLANLRRLVLQSNQLMGEIPVSLAQLADLEALDVDNNFLSGQIPEEIAQLRNLKELGFTWNNFIGCNPTGLEIRNRADVVLEECDD